MNPRASTYPASRAHVDKNRSGLTAARPTESPGVWRSALASPEGGPCMSKTQMMYPVFDTLKPAELLNWTCERETDVRALR